MPNIQLCGFFPSYFLGDAYSWDGMRQEFPANKIGEITRKILQVIQEMDLGEDTVIETILSTVVSCDGKNKPMPYIRVCDTNEGRLKDIVQALKDANINMDVETLLLSGFTEAKGMERQF